MPAVVQEAGINLSDAEPERLTEEPAKEAQVLIAMGCDDKCPYVPHLRRDDWPLRDSRGLVVEQVRAIGDEVRQRVQELIRRNHLG